MITKNELRIGNYLESDGRDLIITGHYLSNMEKGMKPDNPIPITEEWLLNFGFEQRCHLWSIDIDRYNKINYNSDQKIFFSGQLGFSIQHDIKYIHQLQNLYFALTGKELEFIKSEATI